MNSGRQPNNLRNLRWLLWVLAWLAPLAASSPLVTTDAAFEWIDLADHVDMLVDPDGAFDASSLLQSPRADEFVPARPGAFLRTDHTSVYWLRFAIANPDPVNRALILSFQLQRDGEVMAYQSNGGLQAVPLATRSSFQLDAPARSKRLILLRVSPGGLELTQLDLHSIAHYIRGARDNIWLSGLSQGALFVLALSALLMVWRHRDAAYFWLAVHTLALQGFLFFLHREVSPALLSLPPSANAFLPNFLPAIPMALLLLIGASSVGLCQQLPIAPREQVWARRCLNGLFAVSLAALPLALLIPTSTIAVSIVTLVSANAVIAVAIALYNFLVSHQRDLLAYALIRTIVLLLIVGGVLAWNTGSATKSLLLFLLPLAMLAEGISMLALLVWRSQAHDRQQARADRDIAILEAEGRSRTEVVAEVGHRVRTPISGVLGMLDMLQDTPLSAVQLDYLNTIRRAGNELLNVVDEMSDLSRLQNQSAPLQQTQFDPHGLVAECVDGFRSLAAAHRLELINDPAPGLPAFVSGDPTRLRQLILQLLHREIGCYERGDIVIRIMPHPQPNWLRFHIETLAQRVQSTPSEIDRRMHAPGSTSVRTAIARQLIELLGGRFGQREFDNRHAELWFELPLPFSVQNPMALEQNALLRNRQMLIIDDSPTFCDVLRRQATHWGMTVHVATSPSEGLARLRNEAALGNSIDALLIDADMPELTQSDWFQRLHDVQPDAIALLLSSQTATLNFHLRDANVRRVLLKPVNNNSLKITLIEEFKRREQPAQLPAIRDAKPIHCLFAEDNIINAKVLAGMLDKLGVITVGVENGQQAVEAVQRGHFDIVLMDCDMPVMDGWEASERIREIFRNRGLPAIPIIALTANTVEELGERARQPLMDAHLVKPIHLQELRALLENWTGKIIATEKAITS